MNKKSSSWLPVYIALGLTWGCSFIFIKLGLEFLTPVGVGFGRCALGAIALLAVVRAKNISLPKDPKTLFHLWIISLALNVVPGVLFAFAETKVTSILAGIINAVTPLMTLLAIMLISRDEKPTFAQVAGMLLGFVGVLVVLAVWKGLGTNPLISVLALVFSVACYGFSYPYTKRFILPKKLKPEALAATQVTLGAATLLPFYLMGGIANDQFKLGPVLAMLALGIFGSGFAYIWNFKILAAAGSAIASSVTFVTTIVAVCVGAIFLGEEISWHEPAGAVIVLLGVAIAQGRIKLFKSK